MDGSLRPESEEEPASEEQALLEFLYLCPHGLAELDADGGIRMINPACLQLLMPLATDPTAVGNLFGLLLPYAPDLRTRVYQDVRRRGLLLDGVRIHVGEPVHAAVVRTPAAAAGNDPLVLSLTLLRLAPDRLMAVVSDASRIVAQERRLRETEAWFNAVLHGDDRYAFFTLDAAGRIADWNDTGQQLFGLTPAAALHRDAGGVLGGRGSGPEALSERLAIARREGWHVAEDWLPAPDGERFWGTSVVSVMRGVAPEAANDAYLVVVRDATERRSSVDALRRALCVDHLTGVLNRRYFHELAEQACRRAARAGQPLSAIMVDADRFKAINDAFGHPAGDAVLVAIATALLGGIRTGHDQIGRLGGEEFCVLLPGSNEAEAMEVAERLRAAVAGLAIDVIETGGAARCVRVTASFGVAALRPGSEDLPQLLQAADAALYLAKRAGRDRVVAAAAAPV